METYRMQRNNSSIDEFLCTFYNRYLLEKYHVSDTFTEFVNAMMDEDLDLYMDEYRYCGWNFVDKRCIELNDMNVGFPIYLRVLDEPYYPYAMSISERNKSDGTWERIQVMMNLFKLPVDERGHISPIGTKTAMFHECRHCLEMYVTDYNTISDQIFKAYKDILLSKYPKTLIESCMRAADLFAASEQRARIDATVHYLKSLGEECHQFDGIKELIEISDEHNLIYSIERELGYIQDTIQMYDRNKNTEFESESMIDRYLKCIIIGYIYQKYGTNECVFDFQEVLTFSFAGRIDMLVRVYRMLEDNYRKYLTDLTKAIYVHIVQQSPGYVSTQDRLRQWKEMKRNIHK